MLSDKIRCMALYSLLILFANMPLIGAAATVVSRSNLDPQGSNSADMAISTGYQARQAQKVVLTTSSDIKAIKFWGHYAVESTPSDAFRVRFYEADGANDPKEAWFSEQSSLNVSRVSTGIQYNITPSLNPIVYEYRVNLPAAVSLTAGTEYYLEIVNNTTNASAWSWNRTSDTAAANQRWGRAGDGASDLWGAVSSSAYLAYELYDTEIALYDPQPSVPVPVMPAWLFGLIVLVIGLFGVKALPRR